MGQSGCQIVHAQLYLATERKRWQEMQGAKGETEEQMAENGPDKKKAPKEETHFKKKKNLQCCDTDTF